MLKIKLKIRLGHEWYFWVGIILLSLLLFKNPFSPLSSISDLEPLPDTIHYLTATKSLLSGHGLKITYQNRQLSPDVPPLYSLIIAPFIAVFNDPRAFYLANIILVFFSTDFFYLILKALIKNRPLKILIFFSFITDAIIFWYPSVAMSENLLITLYLLSVLLLLKPFSYQKILWLSLVAIGFYATKYIAGILSACLLLVSFFQSQFFKITKLKKIISFGMLTTISIVLFLGLSLIEYSNKGNLGLNSNFSNLLKLISAVTKPNQTAGVDFSSSYFNDNFLRYLFSLVGGAIPVAGNQIKIIPIGIGFISLIGLFLNPIWKKYRLINFYFLISVLTTIFFICFYNTLDARYIFAIIPALILSAAIFLDNLLKFLEQRKHYFYYYLVLFILGLGLIINQATAIKDQLIINFKTGEHSLNYQTVQTINDYFSQNHFSQKPYLISVLPPYLIDFYSNHQYEILPLSRIQYFTNTPFETWGISKGIKFIDIYQTVLEKGYPLFVSDYRTYGYFYGFDFDQIKQRFNLTKVASGCQNQCNLYQIRLLK